jgi:hypothetical protein
MLLLLMMMMMMITLPPIHLARNPGATHDHQNA